MRIIFARHGKDDERYRGGWSDLELLPSGVLQAQKMAEKLKSCDITEIIASDLPRTMQTAGIAGDALGLPVHPEPRLREINNGKLSGMLNTDALREYPGVFFSTLGFDEPYPDGESPHAFFDRIKAWFEAVSASTMLRTTNSSGWECFSVNNSPEDSGGYSSAAFGSLCTAIFHAAPRASTVTLYCPAVETGSSNFPESTSLPK